MLGMILLVASLILFILATVGVPSPPRLNLMAAGLACWVAAQLFGPMLK